MSELITSIFESDSGSFSCDENGLLRSFSANRDVAISSLSLLRHLHIPEGVRRIGWDDFASDRPKCELFRDLVIMGEVTLPASLEILDDHAFYGCAIQRLVIPPTVRRLGHGTLMHCYIQNLVIQPCEILLENSYSGSEALSIAGRDFKETTVENLIIRAAESNNQWLRRLMPEAEILNVEYE